jgi:putative transposase
LYTYEKRVRALQSYRDTHSVTETIRILGYPERQTLYKWIKEQNEPKGVKSTYRGENTPTHPRHPSVDLKLEVLHRCFELGEDIKSVSDEIGYSRASIYTWRRKYLRKGMTALMNPKDDPRGKLVPGTASFSEEINELKSEVEDMRLQIDILKETINVLKKDPGVDQTVLRNREKAAIIDALKRKYSLPILLAALHCPRSSYYYQQKAVKRQDKYCPLKKRIQAIFEENYRCYGYRRIHAALRKEGLRLSEKVIRQVMKEEQLQVRAKKKRVYSSYQGEITPAVPNVIQRNFHADLPNEKWLTDITEFAIPTGKVYLSPVIDCFDGMPVCWSIGTVPNAKLVNGMLEDAISHLKKEERPILHTDRGCHYRWPGWINRMEKAHLQRSMSKKGCSPDNSACEGFFGRMKNEMFYGLSWLDVSLEDFIQIIHDYMSWYREKRIKISLGGMSPLEYRQNLRLGA